MTEDCYNSPICMKSLESKETCCMSGCGNANCEHCKPNAKEEPKKVEEWEKDFDKKYYKKGTRLSFLAKGARDEIKSFTSQTLLAYKAKILESLPEKMENPKGKCMNLETHLLGTCFNCTKNNGFNEALDEMIKIIKETKI